MPLQPPSHPRLPLPTLLSYALVAFTIEFDNEFEHQMPHRITISRSSTGWRTGPWLASMVMWSNLMQYVPEQGVTIAELQRLARIEKLSLAGMERWGYIVVAPSPAESRPKPPRRDWIVRPTAPGQKAQEVWRTLFGIIEQRWHARFGRRQIDQLRQSLAALVTEFDVDLPEYLPVLGYGLVTEVPQHEKQSAAARDAAIAPTLPLPTLLSQVLLAFTLDFERESDLSLAISANVMRLLTDEGVRIRDLPRLSGISKEAIKMALGFLEKRRYVVIEPDPAASRIKLIRLTPKGRESQAAYRQHLAAVEAHWQSRFGKDAIRNLRNSLGPLVGELIDLPLGDEPTLNKPTAEPSPLFRGLDPHPDGWRASLPQPTTLPHHPMVLHRGGYPDGS